MDGKQDGQVIRALSWRSGKCGQKCVLLKACVPAKISTAKNDWEGMEITVFLKCEHFGMMSSRPKLHSGGPVANQAFSMDSHFGCSVWEAVKVQLDDAICLCLLSTVPIFEPAVCAWENRSQDFGKF
jgi:hypothetical protein